MKRLLFILFAFLSISTIHSEEPTIRLKMDCGENNYEDRQDSVLVTEDRQDSVLVTVKNAELNIFHWYVYENCCCNLEPELIISGDTIFVYSTNISKEYCFCMCFFKVNYTIKHLPHGDYTLIIGDKTYKQHVTKLSTQLSFGPDRDTVLVVRQPNLVDTTIVYLEADTYPSFPGGEKAEEKYIADHIQCEHNNELCYAIVSAVVERDGSLSEVKINKAYSLNIDSQHEKQAIEIVRSMPQWIPGKIGNTIVRVETYIVVDFNCK